MDVSQYLNPSRHWVVVYVPLLLFFAFFFWRFFFRLPKKTMLGFAVAGLVFIGGAVGMEIAGDQYMMYRAEPDIYYGLISTAEEVLEMVGIVLFIRAMVFHISVYCQEPKLNIQLITVSGPEKKQPINGVPKMKIKSKGKMEKMTQGKIISLDYSK